MRLHNYINEAKPTMKLEKGLYGKVRIIRGYKNHDKLYVTKHGKNGYCITDSPKITLDNMILIDGEYWFSTLKEIKKALNNETS
jgi:hypothetical protein